MKAPARAVSSFGLATLWMLIAGCESPRQNRSGNREASAAHRVALRGESVYFGGRLRAEATVSRGRPVAFRERAGGKTESHDLQLKPLPPPA